MMDNKEIGKITATNGCQFVNTTTLAVGSFYAFVPNTECTIDTIILSHGNTTSTKSDFSGQTIGQGMFIPAGNSAHPDAVIQSILLSTGNGVAYVL